MKAPASGFSGNPAEEVERKNINSELWHACAGPLVSIPPAGSLVVYFPQGHSEQVAASMQKDADSIPNYSSLPSKLICLLHNVNLHADPETDEVYAEMTLQPVSKCDREAILTSDLGLKQNRQPVEFFCKTLTASDTSTHGGFSVPRRAAEKIFPPLDFSMQPPVQELCAKDLHEASWTFRHIYRGQPKRHLLTTGWSVFVSAKKLLAGDSVLFVRDEKSQLLLGIRRAARLPPSLSSSVLSSDSMQIGILAAAAHAATNNSPFTIFYNPRATPSEFVVPLAKYYKAMYTQVSVGMRFRMMFETEESGIRRYMGTITGITDLDPDRWRNSPWRNLQVGWDESAAGERRNRVSVWEIEPVATPFYFCPPFFRPKYPRLPGILDEEKEIENGYKQGGGWMADDGHGKIVAGQNHMGWMGMQQTLVPSTAAGAATTFQAHGSTLPSLPPALQFPQHQQLLQQSAAALQPQQQMMMAAQQSQPRAAGGGIGILDHLHQEAQVQMMQSQLIMQALPNPNAQAQQNIYVLNQSAAVQPPAAQQLSPPQFQLQILQQLQQQQQVLSQLSPHLHPPQPQPPLQPYLQSQLSHQPPPPLQSQLSHQPPPQLPLPPTRARPADPHLGSIKNESRCTREADNSRHRLGTTDHLEASSSATSFCLDGGGGAEGCSVPPFSLENEVAALLPDALLLKGETLHSLLTAANYGNQRDDPEITSQSFGAPYKPVPSAAAATSVSENGALTRGLRAPQQPRMRTYTKVQKRGSVGRCIDITQYKGYAALRRDLAAMFGIEGQLEDPHRTDWKLVYVDHENDILLVGDDPWEEFVSCVQSIKILSSSEVQQMSLDNLVNVPLDTHYDDNSGTSFGR